MHLLCRQRGRSDRKWQLRQGKLTKTHAPCPPSAVHRPQDGAPSLRLQKDKGDALWEKWGTYLAQKGDNLSCILIYQIYVKKNKSSVSRTPCFFFITRTLNCLYLIYFDSLYATSVTSIDVLIHCINASYILSVQNVGKIKVKKKRKEKKLLTLKINFIYFSVYWTYE